ncbi:hypothetical protein AAH678_06410 [Sodalis endosymbiont of Spalangia cameroni]
MIDLRCESMIDRMRIRIKGRFPPLPPLFFARQANGAVISRRQQK